MKLKYALVDLQSVNVLEKIPHRSDGQCLQWMNDNFDGVCVYVHMHMCVCVHLRAFVCMCVHVCACVCMCVHASDFGETNDDCETTLHKKVFMCASRNRRLYWLYNM